MRNEGKIMELITYKGWGLCIGELFYWRGFGQCEKQNLRRSRNSDERKTAHEPALGM